MYKIIACNIFKRELETLLDSKRLEDVTFIKQGLHNNPSNLKEVLQESIDNIESDEEVIKKYEGIILLYGLCGNGTLGIKSSKVKLIIPKAHDCMTIFLGDKEKYSSIIEDNKGVYWYNHAWIEQTPMPCAKYLNDIRREYCLKYDEDNGEYLYELELNSLMRYSCGMLIKSPLFNNDKYSCFLKEACKTFNWQYKEVQGDIKIIKNLIDGIFNEEEVLIEDPRG